MPETEAVLETARLLLEPLRREHADELFLPLSDSRIYTFIPQDPFPSLAAIQRRYQLLEGRQSPDGKDLWLNWAVRLKGEPGERGPCIGTVQATLPQSGPALIAYLLAPAFQGNGYAVEACRRILRLLFAEYNRGEIMAETDTRNLASQRLLERLSFVRTAVREQADFFKGESIDEYVYRLTGEEWKAAEAGRD